MRLYHDQDADLSLLKGRQIAVIGYGNQGRSQALNLRDSGLEVVIGNREDAYAGRAREDGFSVLPIAQAASAGDIVMLLIPDEVAPEVLDDQITPHIAQGDILVFASGYNVAFGLVALPPSVDVVLVAPRMIGAGVRDLYVAGRGFPAFIGVAQDDSGRAWENALALAKGIGATRAGVVEVTFAQEAEMDLFTEQCFGPAFGHVLTTAVDLLLDEGYPPEAVLLELYMSGELSYTLGKIAEMGLVEQSTLHSPASQYGSMSRGMRFILPELRVKMREGLDEIRSGAFAREWTAEQEAGGPTLETLKEAARSLPLQRLEQELQHALRNDPAQFAELNPEARASRVGRREARAEPDSPQDSLSLPPAPGREGESRAVASRPETMGRTGRGWAGLRHLRDRLGRRPEAKPYAGSSSQAGVLSQAQMERVLRAFIAHAAGDPALQAFANGRRMTTHYVLSDMGLEFTMLFDEGVVSGALGPPPVGAEVRLQTNADVLDGMFTGRINAMRAAMTGKLSFSGDTKLAISIQQIQGDLSRLYAVAREEVVVDDGGAQ